MPIYLYWGEDDFAIEMAASLRDQVLDPQWVSFNYTLLPPKPDAVIQGLNRHDTSLWSR